LSVNPKMVASYKGKEYQLCCYRCKKRFEADEDRYVETIA
jgi:YHS domain-containing protein